VEPEPSDRDGKDHRIQVKVTVPNSTVRSRASFVVPAAAPPPATPTEAVTAALKPGPFAKDLPIQLTAHTLRDPASGQMQVMLSASIGRGVSGPADLRVGYTIVDQRGQLLGTVGENVRLDAQGAGPAARWSYLSSVGLRPGTYTIRLAASGADGRTGSVERRVDARLSAGDGAALSDLLVFDPRKPVKQGWATFVEGRVEGATVGVFVEMYPVKGKSLSSVAFDVSDQPDAEPIVGVRSKPVSADGGRRWSASGEIDLRLLPPGDYVAVATVFDKDKKVGRVSRPFRLEAMPIAAGGPRAAFSVAESGGLVRAFTRQDALAPDALQFFLARLKDADGDPASEALTAAAAAVRGGRFDEAISALAGTGPERLSVPFLKGLALFGKGELEPAAAQFREALRASSEFLPAAFYLGACYAAGGRDREAAGAWQTSLVSESEARIIYDVLADAWLRVDEGEQAESIAREAIGRWPADDGFLPRLAAAQAMQRRGREALDTLAPYLDTHPADSSALFLALRILYDAHAAGGAVTNAAEDAARAEKWAAAYKAASGPRVALVDRWAAFIKR
jgi:tetratricopeptide (TPR) repeat protein